MLLGLEKMGCNFRQGICCYNGSWSLVDSSCGLSTEDFPTHALLSLVFPKLAGKVSKISWLFKARIEITYPVVTVVYTRSMKCMLQ